MSSSEARISVANSQGQYHQVTASNDMTVFTSSGTQRIVMGVGSDGTTQSTAANYLSIGSNDTVIGKNLVSTNATSQWTTAGSITANTFSGSGAGLSNLNAANITGTLAVTKGGTGTTTVTGATNSSVVLSASPALTGTVTCSNLGVAGTISSSNVNGAWSNAGDITGRNLYGNGSNLTSLNATNISTGALSKARGGTGAIDTTGSGNNVLSISPALTGTVTCSNLTTSGNVQGNNAVATWSNAGDIMGKNMTSTGALKADGTLEVTGMCTFANASINPLAIIGGVSGVDDSDALTLSGSNVSVLKNSRVVRPSALVQWAVKIDGVEYHEYTVGVATDSLGNVYVTGFYQSETPVTLTNDKTLPVASTRTGYLIKYNALGDAQWVRIVDGAGGYAIPSRIATDPTGNVYISGYYNGSQITLTIGKTLPTALEDSAFIIKYTTQGDVQWATTINGGGSSFTKAHDITADVMGNVYVTGIIFSPNEAEFNNNKRLSATKDGAAFIVKYDTSGLAQWVVSMDADKWDLGNAIAVDRACNVYITGTHDKALTFNNGQTIPAPISNYGSFVAKYNASGRAEWASPIHANNTQNIGKSIAVDNVGNVYVTGLYDDTAGIPLNNGQSLPASSGHSGFLIKYNTVGLVQWAFEIGNDYYESAFGVATDASGNVYVTGHFYNQMSNIGNGITLTGTPTKAVFVIKYDATGKAQWADKMDSLTDDAGYKITVDAFGNVYVVGVYTAAIALNNNKNLTAPTGANAAFVVKYSSTNATTSPYTLLSNPASTNYKLLVNSSPYPATVTVRNADNTTTLNTLTIGSGAHKAVTLSNAPYISDTIECTSVNVSSGKTIIDTHGGITGFNSNATWSTTGDVVCRTITASQPSSTTMTVEDSDALTLSTRHNASVLKNVNGEALWATDILGQFGYASGFVATDGSGNVYVTGFYEAATDYTIAPGVVLTGATDYLSVFIIKYNAAGVAQWARQIDGVNEDEPKAIAADSAGNVYVTGYYRSTVDITLAPDVILKGGNGSRHTFVVKYDTNGVPLWATTIINAVDGYGVGIAIGPAGAVLVTGFYNSPSDTILDSRTPNVKLAGVPLNSAFVVKYSPADGLPQWARTLSNIYSTHGNGIAVDSNANVYVAGTYALAENLVLDENVPSVYLKPTTSYAAFVIKYSVDGVPLWANQIDASGSDNTNAIAVDASGNVYAGGYYTADNDVILDANVPSVILKATSGTTNNAAFLVKYNTSGVPQWAVQRDTIVDGHYGISVDASGNAYVTGYYNSTTDVTLAPGVVLKASNGDTACTVKYSSSGVPLWANVIDGNDREYGIGISADTYGNVYVAGTYKSDVAITLNTTKGVVLNKTDGGWKTFLVKYAQGYPDYKLISDPYIANGSIKLLVNASAAPATVSVRNAANTATLKTITVNGDDVKTLTWYGNTYYGSQSATSTLTVDDSDSTMLSTRHNVSVLKNTTASISAAWARKIDGAGSDVGKGVAVDAYGNVYATGHYTAALTVDVVAGVTLDAPLGTEAAYIIKYNQDGTALWAKKIDGEGNEAGLGVAVDASGNVYVTGRYNTTGITVAPGLTLDAPLGTHAVFIIKYNSLGTALWAKQIDGTGLDIGYGIAVDAPGNVYVTGYYDGAAITVDAVAGVALDAPLGAAATFLVKYNTFGTALWAKTIDGAGTDVGHGVAVDAHGNVYVTGYINASIIVSPTITLDAPIAVLAAFVIKYNTVGTALWANKIDDGGASHGYGIAVDAPGNVYVTGYYNSQSIAVSPTITLDAPINGTYAVYIVKYNTLGIAQWAKTIDGAGNDQGLGVAVDGSGNVYVTGFYDGRITVALGITLDAPIASLGAFIVKYNTFGTALWAKQIDGGGTDVGHGIAVDVSGNVYATGYYLNAGITVDSVTGVALGAPLGADAAFLVKYTPFTPYRLISDASITNGLHKLVVNSSPYQATVHVRNATNTSTIDTLTIAAGATKALTWYGTQFYQI